MAANITFDTSDFDKKSKEFVVKFGKATDQGVRDVASEILRLSSFEVPHDKGLLQISGSVDDHDPKDVIVGYNKVYAARLHEHPEYIFQKGRKGKYLEDPIKRNLSILVKYIADAQKGMMGK